MDGVEKVPSECEIRILQGKSESGSDGSGLTQPFFMTFYYLCTILGKVPRSGKRRVDIAPHG